MKIKILMAKHTCDYVDLQDLTCINSILLSCLETCDLLFISMVYLSCCFVRYSSDKASCKKRKESLSTNAHEFIS